MRKVYFKETGNPDILKDGGAWGGIEPPGAIIIIRYMLVFLETA